MEGVRPAELDDLGDLVRLAAEAVTEMRAQRGGEMWARTIGRRPPFEEGLMEAITDPDVLVLAGTVEGSVVGYALARLEPLADGTTVVMIEDLFTEAGARTVGVGEAMLGAIVEWGTQRGAVGVDAVVLPGARESKNFFESFGLAVLFLLAGCAQKMAEERGRCETPAHGHCRLVYRQAGRIALGPAQPQLTLEALVDGITPDNVHGEQDWGRPVGKEPW